MPRRFAPWAGLAALVIALSLTPVAAAQTAEPRATLPDIEDEVMCPVCDTLLEIAEAPQAERERELIRRLIDQGLTKDEIKDRLVAEYGEEVLATPEDGSSRILARAVPVLAIVAALALILWFALRRRRSNGPTEPDAALDAPDSARLRDDMSRYDL
jgi:cytochrome c-type biogenesis protein CcmH/NrfF